MTEQRCSLHRLGILGEGSHKDSHFYTCWLHLLGDIWIVWLHLLFDLPGQDPKIVVASLMKLAGGSPSFANELNVEAFLEQVWIDHGVNQSSLVTCRM